MKTILSVFAALLISVVAASDVSAYGCCYFGPPCCAPVCCVSYQYQVVTTCRPEWRAEKVPCTIQKVSYREQVEKVNVTVQVPVMVDEKVRTCFYVPVTKVIERPVTTCVLEPMTMVDPCTGCCWTVCCPKYVTTMVKCQVCEYVMQTRDDVVKVCRMVPEQRVVERRYCVPVVTQEQSWTVQYHCVMVPCQTTVCVPVYTWCCP